LDKHGLKPGPTKLTKIIFLIWENMSSIPDRLCISVGPTAPMLLKSPNEKPCVDGSGIAKGSRCVVGYCRHRGLVDYRILHEPGRIRHDDFGNPSPGMSAPQPYRHSLPILRHDNRLLLGRARQFDRRVGEQYIEPLVDAGHIDCTGLSCSGQAECGIQNHIGAGCVPCSPAAPCGNRLPGSFLACQLVPRLGARRAHGCCERPLVILGQAPGLLQPGSIMDKDRDHPFSFFIRRSFTT
jgi:hypothetical protein